MQCGRPRFDPQVGRTPWKREWQPTPLFLPGKSHGQRSLADYSPWDHKESDTTEGLTLSHFKLISKPFPKGSPGGSVGKESACNAGALGLIPGSGRSPGGGNGNPLQYSCLKNPMDRGVWQTTVHEVARVEHKWVTKPPQTVALSSMNHFRKLLHLRRRSWETLTSSQLVISAGDNLDFQLASEMDGGWQSCRMEPSTLESQC